MLHTRDTDKDGELIQLLIARAHEVIRTHALSKDPDEGGYLPDDVTYEGTDGKRYNIHEVASTWPKTLRSHVVFSGEDNDQVFVLPIAKWVSANFKAIFDQFDFHFFRNLVHDEIDASEGLQLKFLTLRRGLGLSDEHRVPIEYAPAFIDGAVDLVGGHREEMLALAVKCIGTMPEVPDCGRDGHEGE